MIRIVAETKFLPKTGFLAIKIDKSFRIAILGGSSEGIPKLCLGTRKTEFGNEKSDFLKNRISFSLFITLFEGD
jgi:hypothetical protein